MQRLRLPMPCQFYVESVIRIPCFSLSIYSRGGLTFWKKKVRSQILRDFGQGDQALLSFTGQQ